MLAPVAREHLGERARVASATRGRRLHQHGHVDARHHLDAGRPRDGDEWRVNFSRVEWQVDTAGDGYAKRLRPGSKDPLPEDNWVWSPQGAIDMHMPERWGYVQFSGKPAGSGTDSFIDDPNERVKWALRRLYYRQRSLHAAKGAYAATLDSLDAADIRVEGLDFRPVIQTTTSSYEISANGFDGVVVHINQDGRVWLTR